MFDGGVQILTRVVVPFDDPRPALVVGALAAIFGATLVAATRLERSDAVRRDLLRWLVVAAAGLIAAVCGYALFAGAFDYYNPLSPGLADRTNAIASLGFIATAYAAIACLATIAARLLGASRGVAAGVTVGVVAIVFTGYQDRLRASAATWDDAWSREMAILITLQARLPDPPPSSTVYTFGHPVVSSNPGLPIFVSFWELRGAVQTVYDDPTLAAYPALPGTSVACTATGAYLQGAGYPKAYGDVYGQVYLVDVPTQRVERPDTRRQCLLDAAQFHPGPYEPTAP
jgi:hypothetical protein